ncbi:response regulator [Candidatus Woesearchaeota archaeon]|jgi:two-component system, cell cycle sensor histidine kinase and response regulator CckA|nr:response regulator [Candidatus Woesearchaeota archaeon]MBT5272275.1 response regulator [Candidatus Woesearchaeota archaeon]MBT6041132.1 response regulator [Candidatus Woesearchaeota archaeon]MBT6336547.1 response regulator [Candidatus Woesearchaeota archaeon]MBT7927437.1 response regulator [Candidatus Woesearchaeota archaeon]
MTEEIGDLEEILKYGRYFTDRSAWPTYITNVAGDFLHVNQKLVDLLGYSREELSEMNVNDLYASDAKRDLLLKELKTFGEVEDFEEDLKTKKGEKFACKIRAQKIAEDKEEIFYWGSVRDVKEKRILREILIQSEKQASIGTLAAGMAHDFNNLLTIISGYAQVAQNSSDDSAETKKNLSRINEAAGRASDLTQRLLAYARKGKYEKKPVEIGEVINEAIELLSRGYTSLANCEIKTNLNSISYIVADKTQMHQMIHNLIFNSVDAMPEGGEILVETEDVRIEDLGVGHQSNGDLVELKKIPPGRYVKISFTDYGEGIDPDIITKIYDPFVTTKPEGVGTGLGLSGVYGTVRGHHGYIHVNSEKNVGTTFDIYIPASKLQGRFDEESTDEILLERGKGKILIVDDELFILELLEGHFAKQGYKIITAENGDEGFKLYMEERPDIVISDLIMPGGMNGDELYHSIIKEDPRVIFYVMSGYSPESRVQKLREEGIRDFIHKPFNMDKLSELVVSGIKRYRTTPP